MLLGISVFWLALSMLFDGLNTLVLPNQLLGLTEPNLKATALGLVSFAGLVVGMLVQPVAGAASDRLRPRWGRLGFIGLGVLLILGALGLFGAAQNLLLVLLAFTLVQVAANVAQAAQQGLLPDLVPVAWRGTAAGLKSFMDLGGALLGFALLGQLLAGGQTTPALLAIAAVVILTFVLTLALVREPTARAPALPLPSNLRDAFRLDLRRHREFGWLVASRFLFLLGAYMVGRFFLFFVADRLALNPGQAAEQAGALLAGLTLISVLAAPPAGWLADRVGRLPLMVVGAAFSALGVLFLLVADSSWQILAAGALMSLGTAAFASANWAHTADVVPPEQAARFFGLANLGTAGAAAAAGLFGPLVDWANFTAPGVGYSALFALAALAFVASAVALRGIRAPAQKPQLSES